MKNWKIGIRLGIGFGAMVLMTVCTTLVMYFNVRNAETNFDHITNSNVPKILASNLAIESIQNVTRAVIMNVAIEDPLYRTETRPYVVAQRKVYHEAMAKLEKLETNEAGKALIEKMKKQIADLVVSNSKALELVENGKQSEADVLLSTEVETKLAKLLVVFEEMEKYQTNRVKIRTDSAEKAINFTYVVMAVACVLACVFGLLCAIYFTRGVVVPLNRMKMMLQDIAEGEGDLTKKLDASSKDELGDVSRLFNTFVDKLRGIISQIANTSGQVSTAASQMRTTAEQIATGSEEVASQSASVATAGEEMAATSGDIAQNCQMAAEGAQRASRSASDGAMVVERTILVMSQIADKVKESANTVESLGSRSDQIGAIIGTIEDIADQTNLLALNAAIEAARAGEQGRGFAVVADEVRALAERTTRATKEIGEMIKAIQRETKGAVTAMEQGVLQVQEGTSEAGKSGTALQEILQQINDVAMQVNQIATAAEEQTATTNEISNNMHQITDVVQQTSQGAHQSATAAAQLNKNAEELQRLVRQFRL